MPKPNKLMDLKFELGQKKKGQNGLAGQVQPILSPLNFGLSKQMLLHKKDLLKKLNVLYLHIQ